MCTELSVYKLISSVFTLKAFSSICAAEEGVFQRYLALGSLRCLLCEVKQVES